MKNIILGMAILAIALAACNNNGSKSADTPNVKADTNATVQLQPVVQASTEARVSVSIKEIVIAYLQLKNAFSKDNTNEAATAGASLENAFKSFDKTALTSDQKKNFEEVEDDAKEHAGHIGKSGGNIKHQREHFEMLSKDIYELIKTFGAGQVLYKDFCPMYNNNKGAFWVSETKEISNPYLGKKMPTCGLVKEEIK
jgi:hypothetical protein